MAFHAGQQRAHSVEVRALILVSKNQLQSSNPTYLEARILTASQLLLIEHYAQ